MEIDRKTTQLITLALKEDIGPGDITTFSIVNTKKKGRGIIIAKENCVLVGIDIVKKVFHKIDSSITFLNAFADGSKIKKGQRVIEVIGPLSSLLTGERTAINFLQHLSGIATMTNKFVTAIKGTGASILDTRKTTPGWRALEKYAVLMGGGRNHRTGLYDGILIKDNHIQAAGGIERAIKKAKKNSGRLKIEVETETLKDVKEALIAGADIIMLDNMSITTIKKAVRLIDGKALIEVSGNVSLKSINSLAKTGVDFISVGAITHSAPSVDLSMKIL